MTIKDVLKANALKFLKAGDTKGAFTEDNLLLYNFRGSIAHNTYLPSTEPCGTDDIDVAGIYYAPVDHYVGINGNPIYNKGLEVTAADYDGVFYEIRKYLRMCITGNPTALTFLWVEPDHYILKTQAGELLVSNRDLFMTKKVYGPFINYAKHQLKNMLRGNYHGYMGAKRKALIKTYGYDIKQASHLCRLLIMCKEALVTGRLEVYRKDPTMFRNIKRGFWSKEDIEKTANKLFTEAEMAYKRSTLPEDVDLNKVNELAMTLIKRII